jgi:insertion element IS1 protein InsB
MAAVRVLSWLNILGHSFYVGDRSRKSARRLWVKIPGAYRQHAIFYTDQYVGYEGVIPAAQHKAISKLARKTKMSHRC